MSHAQPRLRKFVGAAIRERFPRLPDSLRNIHRRFSELKEHWLLIHPIVSAAPLLEAAIVEGRPYAAGKMGAVEAAVIRMFLRRSRALARGHVPLRYSAWALDALYLNAGVFPSDEGVFDRFSGVYLEALKACDALAWWDVAVQGKILRTHCPQGTLVRFESLDPCFSTRPWSRKLQGKRVLVISPFATTIEQQYAKRRLLWTNAEMLPEFGLLTVRAPLSAGLVAPESRDWFEALGHMKGRMDALDYDVALVGAGAFSLPLVVHAKSRGKVGVHLGGTTQVLFGILGRRWEHAALSNDNWCRPSPEETPSGFKRVEDGCYW